MSRTFVGAGVEFLHAGVVELSKSLGKGARLAGHNDSGDVVRNVEFANEQLNAVCIVEHVAAFMANHHGGFD